MRQQAQDAATRIRENMAKTKATYIAIGRDLLSIKDQLAHGEFTKWIEAEFNMTIRTAQNMMNAAELIKSFAAVSVLPQAVIYKLGSKSTPTQVKADIAAMITNGTKPKAHEVELQITNAKRAAQEQKAKERALKELERKWFVVSKELKTSGKSPVEIEVERKKWDATQARNERRLIKKSQMKTDSIQRREVVANEYAARAVAFLREHLESDFDEFRKLMSNVDIHGAFKKALKAV